MIRRTLLSSGLILVAAVALSAPAQACKLLNQEITDAPKAKVGVFDANGKFTKEVDKTEVVHKRITACNESLGLIEITQADGQKIWLDPIEVKIPGAPANDEVCVAKNSTKTADSKQAVSNGAGPSGKPCSAQ